MLQKIAKPLEFSRLRCNGILIRWVVSDDVKRKPVEPAQGQIFLVEELGSHLSLVRMPDVTNVHPFRVHSDPIVGVDESGDLVEEAKGYSKRRTEFLHLNTKGRIIERVREEYVLVHKMLFCGQCSFVQKPTRGNIFLFHLIEPRDKRR